MKIPFLRSKAFRPNFPIIPLNADETEARGLLSRHADVRREGPENDHTIAQAVLVAETEETRISVGIWDARVRFVNYLTSHFNDSDELKRRKLHWFVDYYGGIREFTEPKDTGFMIFWRNPKRKIILVFGLHMGPVRVIDEDPAHWPDSD
jgi:hypothetical protein